MPFTYRGLKADLERHIVTEEEINRQLERLRQQSPRIAVIDNRPTQSGDEVVLNYAGFCGGVQFPGGTAENQTLVLGRTSVRHSLQLFVPPARRFRHMCRVLPWPARRAVPAAARQAAAVAQ